MRIPTAPEAERGLVGCALLGNPDAVETLLSLPPSALFTDAYRTAREVVARVAESGKPVDPIAVDREWKRVCGGSPAPVEVLTAPDAVASPEQAANFRDEVLEAASRRDIIERAQRAIAAASDPGIAVESAAAILEPQMPYSASGASGVVEPREAFRLFIDDMERRVCLQGSRSGIPTGFRTLDDMTDGLQFGELSIIGARPSVGKTAILCDVVRHACLANRVPTLFVTCEMSPAAILRRLYCASFKVPIHDARRGLFTPAQQRAFAAFISEAKSTPLYFVNALSGWNVDRITTAIRSAVRRYGVKLVALDYVQKIPPASKHEKRTYEVGSVSTALKAAADRSGVALVATAQLSREPEKDRGRLPRASDLADSAQLERDADLVALLHRDRADDGNGATLFVAKQRDGEVGPVPLRFNPPFATFENP